MDLIWFKTQPAPNSFSIQHELVVSEVTQYQRETYRTPLSIKLVLKGEERYTINNQRVAIQANQFYIANFQDEVCIDFKNDIPALGICLHPPLELINDAVQYYTAPEDIAPSCHSTAAAINCIDRIYRLEDDDLGLFLWNLSRQFLHYKNWGKVNIDLEQLYEALSHKLVLAQLKMQRVLRSLPAQKRSTQLELFKRVAVLRDYIEDNYTQSLNSDDFSRISCLSKYHLIRSFRECFGKTPHQYLLHKRLTEGWKLRKTGRFTYPEIAAMVGYSDHTNLRKALKKQFLPT